MLPLLNQTAVVYLIVTVLSHASVGNKGCLAMQLFVRTGRVSFWSHRILVLNEKKLLWLGKKSAICHGQPSQFFPLLIKIVSVYPKVAKLRKTKQTALAVHVSTKRILILSLH